MKANTYRMLKRRLLKALIIKASPFNITLKTFMTNLKIKRCGVVNITVEIYTSIYLLICLNLYIIKLLYRNVVLTIVKEL